MKNQNPKRKTKSANAGCVRRLVRLRRGKWRVQWFSPLNGCIRQEWVRTMAQAVKRQSQLHRGHLLADIYQEQAAEHSELSHDGTTNINREAELRRPTVIGSGDLFGISDIKSK